MDLLPESARKARRSSKKVKTGLPRVEELLIDLGFSRQDPLLDKALRRELDDTLKAFIEKFFARKNLQRGEVNEWAVQSHQDIFRQLATSFLQEGGRGSYFWPDPPSPANKKGYCFSKDRKKICDLLMPLAFRRNKDWAANQKNKLKQAHSTTPTNTVQQQTAQQQTNNSETACSHEVRAIHIPQAHGSSFETPIDVDGLPDFDVNSFNDYSPSNDEPLRNPKYLRDPGFPSPELSLPPMAPPPATVEDEIDEYYLETPKRAPRERTQTVAPEETDAGPTQDPYDVPNSPEAVAPSINQGEKRPAETELEKPARRTKSPRLGQGSAAITPAPSAVDNDDDDPPHSPVDQVTNNNDSDGETRQAQLYEYVLPDGLSRIDGLPGPMPYQGSPELGEDVHREALARRSAAFKHSAKAPLALMSDAPDPEPEPEVEAEASRKQPEMDPLEGAPLDEPHKSQAHPREDSPQGNVSPAPPQTDGDIQDKPKSQPSHPDKPEEPVPVTKGKQQPKEPQVEEVLTHEPARDATFNPDLTFAFTVYQTEMCPRTWNYSERDFFNGSLRELVDELPMENKHSLRGLCITLMAKLPDQYQVFLYNEVKYGNVKEIYLTTIKQEMQEAKLDGSRLDYEVIIRPIR